MNQLTEKQQKAKALIYQQGKSQKEAAAITGVTERTICNWKKSFEWEAETKTERNANNELLIEEAFSMPVSADKMKVKRAKAMILIEQKGYNKKQAAAAVGVSEKTMQEWTKQKPAFIWGAFLTYLKSSNEGLYKELIQALQAYKKQSLNSV